MSAHQRLYPDDNLKAYVAIRRNLRSHGTPAEGAVWRMLKNRQMLGLRFRRQYSIGPYILDFFCPELRLAIELDGEPHYSESGRSHDKQRTDYLKSQQGVEVWRFENRDVFAWPQSAFVDGLRARLTEKMKQMGVNTGGTGN
ncbi:MAG: DUF559 domain-containing protein [Bacteroidaceae bacterium]|nr:DUF559 domain-containing protein [Bacteroidaceae bacterium]